MTRVTIKQLQEEVELLKQNLSRKSTEAVNLETINSDLTYANRNLKKELNSVNKTLQRNIDSLNTVKTIVNLELKIQFPESYTGMEIPKKYMKSRKFLWLQNLSEVANAHTHPRSFLDIASLTFS